MDAQIVRDGHLDQVGMENGDDHSTGMGDDHLFQGVDHAHLHPAHGFAIGENSP